MINRRHIRIKVMQSLYSYFSSSNNDIRDFEKGMMKSLNRISDLHFIMISFFIEMHKYSLTYIEDSRSKNLPSSNDLDPSMKFTKNRVIKIFLKDQEILVKNRSRSLSIWKKDELGVVRKIFLELIKSDQYKEYISSSIDNFEEDKNFIQIILSDFLLNNNIFHHILQEEDIYWIDDLPFVSVFLINQINFLKETNKNNVIVNVFKKKDDKQFAIELFRKTILHEEDFESLIDAHATNWELERIANMDILLIKMALCEIIEFKEMPIKVTFNEYIEISKYYSTKNSRVFINGVLDNIVSEFKNKGKINKIGRGLV